MPETVQTATALERMFNARAVAVVGASNDPRKFGCMTLDCLIKGGFKGALYPVNPKADQVLGLKAYPSIEALPGPIDLVSVIVPARFAPEVIRQAGAKGAAGAVVHSGGFSEAGNFELEAELLASARQYGMRIMGPNVQGVNYLPNKMCCMFLPVIKTKGPLAVITQSGSVTTALSEWPAREGLGISAAVNLGNQADLCESDYLEFFSRDEATKAIVMYLEGVKDGRRFMAALRRTTAMKPVVILKAGRTEVGRRSAASHTGSLASSYRVFASAGRQCGAFMAKDMEQAFDAAKALACVVRPRGGRLLSVSSSGGAGTLAGDHAAGQGLTMPLLDEQAKKAARRAGVPAMATVSNPLDMVSLDAGDFERVMLALDGQNAADIFLLNLGDPLEGAARAAENLARKLRAAFAVSYFGGGAEEQRGRKAIQRRGVAVFPTPERAVRALGAVVWYADWLAKHDLVKGRRHDR